MMPSHMEQAAAIQTTLSGARTVLRWFFCATGAASCWWMASRLYLSWQSPLAVDNGHWVSLGPGILIMEMVLVHSGVMMVSAAGTNPGPRSPREFSRTASMIVTLVFYVVFGAAIAAGFKVGMELFWSFLGIVISRWASFSSLIPARQKTSSSAGRC